ncbi:MAG: hypothetical protein ACT4P0_02380 [Panacagrimonas sp.]
MNITIEVTRQRPVTLSAAQVAALLRDTEGTLRQFPKLKKLTPLGNAGYQLDLKTIGSPAAKIAHDVVFGTRCTVEPDAATVRWEGLRDIGNAVIDGRIEFSGEGAAAALKLTVYGELRGVPVPAMFKAIAPAFIQGKFSALADEFLERIEKAAESSRT